MRCDCDESVKSVFEDERNLLRADRDDRISISVLGIEKYNNRQILEGVY